MSVPGLWIVAERRRNPLRGRNGESFRIGNAQSQGMIVRTVIYCKVTDRTKIGNGTGEHSNEWGGYRFQQRERRAGGDKTPRLQWSEELEKFAIEQMRAADRLLFGREQRRMRMNLLEARTLGSGSVLLRYEPRGE